MLGKGSDALSNVRTSLRANQEIWIGSNTDGKRRRKNRLVMRKEYSVLTVVASWPQAKGS